MQAETSGVFPDTGTLANPIQLLVESKGKYLYVANQGNNTTGNNPESGIAGYEIYTSPSYELQFIAEQPFGSGSGPQCKLFSKVETSPLAWTAAGRASTGEICAP